MDERLERRAAVFAALGEPVRLALVDRLVLGDASPGELPTNSAWARNLLAHHLKVLEDAGVIRRLRSEGDSRRSYVQLRLDDDTVAAVGRSQTASPPTPSSVSHVLFVCTANSARSQLAAARWNASARSRPPPPEPTRPARVHPRAVRGRPPARARSQVCSPDQHPGRPAWRRPLIVAVCDNAHEELEPRSAADPLVDPRPRTPRRPGILRGRLRPHQ